MNYETAQQVILFESEYAVETKTQTRFDTLYTENTAHCFVKYGELRNSRVRFEIDDFRQTSTALVETVGAELSGAISKLVFRVGETEYLEEILNTNEIWDAWRGRKGVLLGKYPEIPDFIGLLDVYAENLKDGAALLSQIRHKGLYGLFFPQLKHLARGQVPAGYGREKMLKNYVMAVDLPVTEQIYVRRTSDEITIETEGKLNVELFDYPRFVELSRRMFGKDVRETDIDFHSRDQYVLHPFSLQYLSGRRRQYFEIKGKYFKNDELSFALKNK